MTAIARIKIHNILGIDHLEVEAGRLTEFVGANGTGKTSALEAIRNALKGGHDATLLRAGQTQGEAVLVLDDGTEIVKRVTPTKSETVVTGPDGRKQAKPAAALDALRDLLSVNPVEFLRAPKKDRVDVLLSSMPLQWDPAKVKEAVAPLAVDVPTSHPLVAIEAVRRVVYDERTGTQRAAREKRATVKQLADTIPPTMPTASDTAALLDQIAALDVAKDRELERIRAKLDGIRADHEAKVAGIRDEFDAKIRELTAARDAAVEAERISFNDIRSKADTQRLRTTSKHLEDTGALRAQLAAAEEATKAAARVEATRKTVADMTAACEDLEAQAEGQTAALERLDAYKSQLLATLPIPGLTVQDGEVYRNGIPFDRLNTAQQIEIAVEVARLRAGRLGVICVDGMEALDPERYAEFGRQVLASGLQVFVTRADAGEFQVRTTNP
ncbi:MAG: Bordetella phage vB BbrM [Planctomycetota bacterium]|jgi:DNA repair exonuclease SbcCD ATPase subunit